MKEFYVLEPVEHYFSTKWAYGEELDPVYLGEVDRCPVCNMPMSLKPWLPPYRARLSTAKPEKWGDFLWIGGTEVAVNERFMDIYHREGLTGIDSFTGPIEIVRYGTKKSGDFPVTPPNYFVIRVPWDGANQDDTKSMVIHRRPEKIKCSYCRSGVSKRKQSKVIIDPTSWNGNDIFRPRGAPVQYMVSEKFFQVCTQYQVKNVWLIPGRKYAIDEIPSSNHPLLWYVNEENEKQ